MRPITKRLIGRQAAAAQRNYRATLQTVGIAGSVNNFKVTFYFYRSVVVDDQFCFSHLDKFYGWFFVKLRWQVDKTKFLAIETYAKKTG